MNALETYGSKPGWVETYTMADFEITARILLPFGGSSKSYTWSELTSEADLELNGVTRWSEISKKIPNDLVQQLEPPFGCNYADTATILHNTLYSTDQLFKPVHGVTWDGYTEEADLTYISPAPLDIMHLRLVEKPVTYRIGRADWVMRNARDNFGRFPLFWWPDDRSHVLACPIYHDSLYFSGSTKQFADLKNAGLEILEIDPHQPLPSEGS